MPHLVGAPIRPPASIPRPFFVGCKAAVLTAKSKGGRALEPAVPVDRVHEHLSGLLAVVAGEDAILDDGADGSHVPLAVVSFATKHGFPNRIAHVRESEPASVTERNYTRLFLYFTFTSSVCPYHFATTGRGRRQATRSRPPIIVREM